MPNFKPIANLPSPLLPTGNYADRIVYNSFTLAQTNTTLWTPASGKRIVLTGVMVAASLAVNVTLQRAGNAAFIGYILNATLNNFAQNFIVPLLFLPDESITLTTSVAATVNITLAGFEI